MKKLTAVFLAFTMIFVLAGCGDSSVTDTGSKTGADLFEVVPADDIYPTDDYNKLTEVAKQEQNDNARPKYAGELPDLSKYDLIFIGGPVWWGQAPRIMDTFVESYDFTGITVIPFCTSGSSPIGSSAARLSSLAGTGIWLVGHRFSSGDSESDIKSWIEGLSY